MKIKSKFSYLIGAIMGAWIVYHSLLYILVGLRDVSGAAAEFQRHADQMGHLNAMFSGWVYGVGAIVVMEIFVRLTEKDGGDA